jgi:hypothetical protein
MTKPAKFRKGQKVFVRYTDNRVPDYCHYIGPGIYWRKVMPKDVEYERSEPAAFVVAPASEPGSPWVFPLSALVPGEGNA